MFKKGQHFAALLGAALSMGELPSMRGRSSEDDPLFGINIEEEYQLIQKKQSTLSRMNRDRVVRIYERRLKDKGE